jgi:hypothetical protein
MGKALAAEELGPPTSVCGPQEVDFLGGTHSDKPPLVRRFRGSSAWAARERLVVQDRVIEHPRATLIVPLSDTSHLSHCRTDGTHCDARDTASKGPRESCELGDLFGSGVPQTALLSHCRIAVAPCDTCDRAI